MLKLNAGLIANIHLMAGLTAITGILNRFLSVCGHELSGRMKALFLSFVALALGSES